MVSHDNSFYAQPQAWKHSAVSPDVAKGCQHMAERCHRPQACFAPWEAVCSLYEPPITPEARVAGGYLRTIGALSASAFTEPEGR
jgi:hypothetical protein